MIRNLGEDYVFYGDRGLWIRSAAMTCDIDGCDAEVRGETSDIDLAITHDGWTVDRTTGLVMCPDCRRRISREAA